MELSWSTFILEIINFLVLVWILKRFLYRPVLEVIERRKAGIDKVRADAQSVRAEAEQLQQQYESRLADWNRERQQARDALHRELETERARKLEACRLELEQEREKARVAETSRQAEAMHLAQQTALAQGAEFAARVLRATAGAETQAKLVELVIDGLAGLPDERLTAIRASREKARGDVVVTSASALTDDQRERLERALQGVMGAQVAPRYEENSELLAGIRIVAGDWLLGCNVKDELDGMTDLLHAG